MLPHPTLLIQVCNLQNWQILLGLLLPFILGYLLGRFLFEKYKTYYHQLESTKQDLVQSESRNQSLMAELEVAQSTQKTYKDLDIPGLQTKVSVLENQTTHLQSLLNDSETKLKSYEGLDIPSLQARVSEYESRHNQLKSELENLHASKSLMEGKIAGMEDLHNQFQGLLSEHEKVKNDLNASLEEKKGLLEQLGQVQPIPTEVEGAMGLKALHLELEKWKNQAEEAKSAHIADSEKWNQNLENLKSLHNEHLENLKREQDTLISSHLEETDTWKKKAEDCDNQMHEMNERYNMLKVNEESLKNEINSLTDHLVKSQQELETFRFAHPAMAQETESLRNQLSGSVEEANQAKTKIQELEEKLNAHTLTLQGYEEQLGAHANTLKAYEEQIGMHTQTIQGFEAQWNQSQKEKEDLHASIQVLKEENSQKQHLALEMDDLKSKILLLEEENAQLRNQLPKGEELSSDHIEHLEHTGPSETLPSDSSIFTELPWSELDETEPVHIESPKQEDAMHPPVSAHSFESTPGESVQEIDAHSENILHSDKLEKPEGENPTQDIHISDKAEQGYGVPSGENIDGQELVSHEEIGNHHEIHKPEPDNSFSNTEQGFGVEENQIQEPKTYSHEPFSGQGNPEHPSLPIYSGSTTGEGFAVEGNQELPIQETGPFAGESETHALGSEQTSGLEGQPSPENTIYTRNQNIYQDPNFVFRLKGYQEAHNAYLVGDFENWEANHYVMHRGEGEWVFPIHLQNGKYLYKFIVDGEWILDPVNPEQEPNEFGTGNSVVHIG